MARTLGCTRYTEFEMMAFVLYAKIFILDAQYSIDAKFGTQVKNGFYIDTTKVHDTGLDEKEEEMKHWMDNDLLVLPEPMEIDTSEYNVMSLDEMAIAYSTCNSDLSKFSEASRCSKVCINNVEISLNDMNKLSFEKDGRIAFKVDACLEDTSGMVLDMIIWDEHAENIMGVSYGQFIALDEAEQGEKLDLMCAHEYTVYIEGKVKLFRGKRTLQPQVKKIEIAE